MNSNMEDNIVYRTTRAEEAFEEAVLLIEKVPNFINEIKKHL